ncbi:shikimate kinase [Halovulum sp. GXIMD14793]
MTRIADSGHQLRLTRTIMLVGLMGAGKTSVGRRLASVLKVPFNDSDHEIELAAGMKIAEIFDKFGEAYFRDGEKRVIARLLDGRPMVLATGGGAFMSPEIRAAIAEHGVSVWLNAGLETLWDRVKDRTTRPLLLQPNAKQVLSDLLEKRNPVYAEAQVHVMSEAGQAHEAMVGRIVTALHEYDQQHPDRTPILERATE